MKLEVYRGSVESLQKINKLLFSCLIGMCVVLVVMSFALYRAIGYKSTILMPPVLTQQMTISDVMPDVSYLQQMGLYLISLRLNVTPSNVEHNFKAFLLHVRPNIYGLLQSTLNQETKEIENSGTTSAFYPRQQEINIDNLAVKITGRLDKYVGKRQISSRDASFVLVFRYSNGSLSISDYYRIKEKS